MEKVDRAPAIPVQSCWVSDETNPEIIQGSKGAGDQDIDSTENIPDRILNLLRGICRLPARHLRQGP